MIPDSQEVLAEYKRNASEIAFRELVRRHIDFVYSTAIRLVDHNTYWAEEVTQTVFVDLARMAHNVANEAVLGAWLHRHACFVAAKLMRSERRRSAREKKAVEMNSLNETKDTGSLSQ